MSSGLSVKVTPKKKIEIERLVYFRQKKSFAYMLEKGRPASINALDLFEFNLKREYGFEADVRDLPSDCEGLTDFSTNELVLSVASHDQLGNNEPRGIFTVCHELGHIDMHKSDMSHCHLSRVKGRQLYRRRGDIKAFECSEWQADYYSGSLQMPYMQVVDILEQGGDEGDLQRIFNVSFTAARKRVGYVNSLRKG